MRDLLISTAEIIFFVAMVHLLAYFLDQPADNVAGWVALGIAIIAGRQCDRIKKHIVRGDAK